MSAYVLSPEALQDLEDIWDFIASDNVNAANKLQDEFFKAFEELARLPRMGHTRIDLTKRGVRFWPVGSYLIVYREAADGLQTGDPARSARYPKRNPQKVAPLNGHRPASSSPAAGRRHWWGCGC